MCEATAFLLKDEGQEELVLEGVEAVESSEEGVRLVNIFGEEKVVKASIKSFSLVEHRIVLEPIRP